ncbi:unnamed protein product [Lepeophtheirus salmonis]|uniref:(salmon louse) hypothetical protein n=1 Tax=Lepeophtheirus salmonis TaxID=72036 RepID=A0A7R8CZ38_LEPSM|nr:unnamed protein product [Lepeophtheirus salmonis]CAF2972549.1 unnamed protein product [Lepeophtheirus salmonis]
MIPLEFDLDEDFVWTLMRLLKTRSLGPAFMSDDVITVSSHESAQASLQSSNKPGEKEVGGRSSNKARWCNPSDTSSRQTTTDPSNNRKERSLKSVEEWLWDARSGESTLANEICDELILKTKMKENDNSKPLFDLSKKEFAMTATFATKSQAPSQQSSSLWEDKKCSEGGDDSKCSPFDGKLMDAAENNRREGRRDIPIHRGLGALGSTLDEYGGREIEEEDVLIINNPDEEETDSNDDKSSGYVGSEERSRSASGSRASSSIKDETQQITYISTKLYRQALGRKRRYTSTPHCSPNTSYESLLSTLMPPPPPPGPNISIIEEPIY